MHTDDHPTGPRHLLRPEPLTAQSFAPYGEVLEAGAGGPPRLINGGHADRHDDLARIDADHGGARPVVSLYRSRPWALPLHLQVMERHRLGSQLFMPLGPQRFLVVVAEAGGEPDVDRVRCFVALPGQGVNLARGTWHHPLLTLRPGDFLVIERGGDGIPEDCELRSIAHAGLWIGDEDTTRSSTVPLQG